MFISFFMCCCLFLEGEKEVDSEQRLKDILGLTCRPVEETMRDMARTLFKIQSKVIGINFQFYPLYIYT